MKTISLFHPFTPNAVGLPEAQVPHIHSQPHAAALLHLTELGWQCRIEYLTETRRSYSRNESQIRYRFWTRSINPKNFRLSTTFRQEYSLLACLSMLLVPPDILILNMSGLGSDLTHALARVCGYRGKPFFTMVGGVNFGTTPTHLDYFRQSAKIIVHNKSTQNRLQNTIGLKNHPVELLPLGVDEKHFYPAEIRGKLGNPSLLCVGRWQRIKGIHRVVDAFGEVQERFPEAQLHFVGPRVDEEYATEVHQQIISYGLSHAVFVHGTQPYQKLPQWYQNADLTLLLSDPGQEGFGMVIIESMACGTPVVALRGEGGGANDIITSGIDGLLVEEHEVGQSLIEMLSNEAALDQMRTAARKTVLARYTQAITAQTLHNILTS